MRQGIGLVGEIYSGKGSFANCLVDILGKDRVSHHRFSDVLHDLLEIATLAKTRHNFQEMAEMLNHTFGANTLTNAVRRRLAEDEADIVIADGVRWWSDVDLIRSLPCNRLTYVTAFAVVRHKRARTQKEKEGQEFISLEQFLLDEQAETELLIPEIGLKADPPIITNNGSIEELRRKAERFCEEYILK